MKYYLLLTGLAVLLYSCNNKTSDQVPTASSEPKGEFAFLLKYDGKMPSDVGFLTNHVVERRLANILKDSFQVFIARTKFDRPIMVSSEDRTIAATFYSDSDRTEPSATVTIDVTNDAIWADYLLNDSIIEYTDHASLQKPGIAQ